MHSELSFISDVLNKRGLQEGDRVEIRPFTGRKRTITLSRLKYDFVTDKSQSNGHSVKVLESIQGEKLHFELRQLPCKTLGSKKYKRYFFKSLCGVPFRLNGSFVFESMIEIGDRIEFGYHQMQFLPKKEIRNDLSLTEGLLQNNKKIIASNLPILIEGETGVGKTSLAKRIHELSGGAGHFVHINISSFSKSLMESELFGHVRGAFTGAQTDKVGALKLSHGGTLFIDEVDSLPREIQTKLLIFLDDQQLKPVGATFSEKVDTRIICASGKNLESLVTQQQMRMDFYYRIASGLKINIPALRDKPELITKFCQLYGLENKVGFTQKLLDFYCSLPWPGNIRQLKGHIDKKLIMNNGSKLDFDGLDDKLVELSSSLFSLEEESEFLTMNELKNSYAKKVFYQCNKNLAIACKKLGISHRVLKRIVDDVA